MWQTIYLIVISISLADLTKGSTITSLPGKNKTLQWRMNTMPPENALVLVLHPSITDASADVPFTALFTVLGTTIIPADNNVAKRLTNPGSSNTNTGNIEFTLTGITMEDGGDYRTKYSVEGQPSVMEIGTRLVVYGKPIIPTVSEVSPPVVGKDMTLNCSTQSKSKPDDHGLQMKYKWYKNGADLPSEDRYVTSGSHLQVTKIIRADASTIFTCKAFETETLVSDISAVYTVVLQYGPEPIVLSPSALSYTLREHDDDLNEITCTSNCNPACTYNWKHKGSPSSTGQILSGINNIKRDQAGQYTCDVTNIHGDRTIAITIIVQYIPDAPVLSRDSNADVRESLPKTLVCTAKSESVPPAKLTIHTANMTGLSITNNVLKNTLSIPHVNCLDTGLFFCSAENIIGMTKSIGVNVNVLCKPRPDHRFPQELKQGLRSGENMNISGTLISNPLPAIYWSMRLNESVSNNLTNNTAGFTFHNSKKLPTITSRAIRTDKGQAIFGEYLMHAHNDYGESVMVFTVSPTRHPDEPELLSVECEFDTAVEVTFKPNFDGGDTQIFSIGMKSESDSVYKKVGEELPDNKQQEMTLRGPSLETDVLYVFNIISTNAYGTSYSTNQLRCKVDDQFNVGAVVGGAVAGSLFIIVVIIGSVFLLKRRRNKEKADAAKQANGIQFDTVQDEADDGMKQNILYESAGPIEKSPLNDQNGNAQKETSVNAVYAEVVKPKNKKVTNDVYAEVVKPKGKKDDKKGKGKKKKPDQQYGNIGISHPPNRTEGDVYENTSKIGTAKEQPSRKKNEQGLVYVDIETNGKNQNQKNTVIHGIENRNQYADVDFTKHADPLPSDDEEEDNATSKTTTQ